jgi:hypothetical protein
MLTKVCLLFCGLLIGGCIGSDPTFGAPTGKEPPLLKGPCAEGCKCGCKDGKPCSCAQADVGGIYLSSTTETTPSGPHVIGGVATIVREGDVYLFSWVIGSTHMRGIGIRQNDALCVSWHTLAGGMHGVSLYKLEGTRLLGRWASTPGNARLQKETLTFLRALPAEEEP